MNTGTGFTPTGKRGWIVLLLMVFLSPLRSQDVPLIDSMKTALTRGDLSDSAKGYTHLLIGREYYPVAGNDSAGLYHYKEGLKRLKDRRLRGVAYFFIHAIHNDNFDSSHYYLDRAEPLLMATDSTYLLHLYRNQSITYQNHGYFQSSVDYTLKSLNIAEALGDTVHIIRCYTDLSSAFHNFEDFEEGKKYGRKAIAMAVPKKSELVEIYAGAINQLAVNFDDDRQHDSALFYHFQLMRFLKESGDSVLLQKTYNNIGNSLKKKGLRDSALMYLERSLELLNIYDPGNDYARATLYTNLADIMSDKGEFPLARRYLVMAEKAVARDRNYEKQRDVLYLKYVINKRQGYPDSALSCFENYYEYRDSVIGDRNARLVKDLEVAYRTQKKEKENARLLSVTADQELKLSTARNRTIILGSIAGLLLLTGGFGYRTMRLKQIAQRAEAEEKLQRARFQSVMEAEEKERMRIARDLHDGLGQILATAKLNVASLEGDQKSEEEEALVSRSMSLLDHSIKELRAISHAMMPTLLQQKGLRPALEEMAESINVSMKVQLQLEADEDAFPEDPARQSSLYRIIQEVTNNMLKHSRGNRICLNLRRTGNRVKLKIADNGKGFDTKLIYSGKGLGWESILSRVELMDGHINIESSSSGTTVFIEIPV